MNRYCMKIEDLNCNLPDPSGTFILFDGDREVFRRVVRILSEEDLLATRLAVCGASNLRDVDVDQQIAELIGPIRSRLLQGLDEPPSTPAANEASPVGPRYVVVVPPTGDANAGKPYILDTRDNLPLTNFVLSFEEDVDVQDDIDSQHEFAGTLSILDRKVPFRIAAEDFADNSKFKAALFKAGGCDLVIDCGLDELRRAVSIISHHSGRLRKRSSTTNFGWTHDMQAYLTPSLRISQAGVDCLNPESDLRVDLKSDQLACHLDLRRLDDDELLRVKRHIVQDLLALNDRMVTHTLLGATAASVLYPFARGAGRFAFWLVGRTGAGKSFLAKLFTNFFGNFPVSAASFTTWSATANFIQRQGYFFKDALYLVDDYKPDVIPSYQVVRVLQSYADNAARGRLKADATANVLRPIRGLLVCTGEDVPEHSASAIARSIIIHVPQQGKNVAAGTRCLSECANYGGVLAAFLQWLLAGGRQATFAQRFAELQKRFNDDVAGQQNDIRVASNLAQLGAAFELFAEFLGDAWEDWREVVRLFVEVDLVAIRDSMLGEAREQQASEVFLKTLADLVGYDQVRILGPRTMGGAEHKPVVGRSAGSHSVRERDGAISKPQELLNISTSLALAQVNTCLRQQGRPELRITESALLQQLREDSKLLDPNGVRLGEGSDLTRRVRFDGGKQLRAFTISKRELLGD